LAIICAGAASDAQILGRTLSEALAQQPGDENVARDFLNSNPLIETPEELEGLLMAALNYTAKLLDDPTIWNAIKEVAETCTKNGGRHVDNMLTFSRGEHIHGRKTQRFNLTVQRLIQSVQIRIDVHFQVLSWSRVLPRLSVRSRPLISRRPTRRATQYDLRIYDGSLDGIPNAAHNFLYSASVVASS
jgi:hypothetical protein